MTVAPIPLIMDVDTGIDDAFALMFAVRHPGLELRAVTCVNGNCGIERVLANTRYALDAAGGFDGIPIARGAAQPLLGTAPHSSHRHGPDGLGGFARQSDRRLSALSAIELLRHELLAAVATGEPITLVATGPLTNIALVLRSHPEVAGGIERLVFMGGSASVGNVTAVAEHNVYHDPEAAAITLAAAAQLDIPVTMYGLDVLYQVRVDRDQIGGLRDLLDPACELAEKLLRQRARQSGVDGPPNRTDAVHAGPALLSIDEQPGHESASLGDAGTLCAVVDPEGSRTERWPVRVETGYGLTRGQTVVDRRPRPAAADAAGPGATDVAKWTGVDIVTSVDGPRWAELWLRTLAG